jgi:hypothetical protein
MTQMSEWLAAEPVRRGLSDPAVDRLCSKVLQEYKLGGPTGYP